MDAGIFDVAKAFDVVGNGKVDDDFVDRLNHYWTTILFVIFALVVSVSQFVGTPIKCWAPQHFTKFWIQYAENYCWVKNTYWTPMSDSIPDGLHIRKSRELQYYQWVPFMLAAMAMLYYLTAIFWRHFNFQTGIDIRQIVKMSFDACSEPKGTRDAAVAKIANIMTKELTLLKQHVDEGIVSRLIHGLTTCFCSMCCRRSSNYLCGLYICSKVLYVVNAIGQFFLLNKFLSTDGEFYMLRVVNDLRNGLEWPESGHFPRVTFCDFGVRAVGGHRQNYTMQCVLMVNLFNEKIFIAIWFWMLLIAVITCLNFLTWLFRLVYPNRPMKFANRYLPENADPYSVKQFVQNTLRNDGILIVRLVALNAGEVITTELMTKLYELSRQQSSENNFIGNPDITQESQDDEGQMLPNNG